MEGLQNAVARGTPVRTREATQLFAPGTGVVEAALEHRLGCTPLCGVHLRGEPSLLDADVRELVDRGVERVGRAELELRAGEHP